MTYHDWIKIICSVIIIGLAFLCGIYAVEQQKTQLSRLEALIQFINHLKNRIYYTNDSLPSIINQYTKEFSGGELISCGFLIAIQNAIEFDLPFDESIKILNFPNQVTDELSGFFYSLGSLPLAAQLKTIDKCLSELEKLKNDLSLLMKNKQKSYRALSLLIGAAVVILIY